ncbi:sigma-70 family RNA polymerase sigma factor [Amycolatopsis sp. DSM 110486]|uniref:sigma-70 family RNA polymerase sigma factor n=1 Tax=Amycolatopsis sp. DSM 110486 TaxID=2865832 RepID=UPI001C69D88E|nr:sigma-70 family RNA polymerase sigma factor [Amycolatopsis sp. DSM 110486]QYN18574.1 sigma-70 family RNA polymerase sigma factor [Amycolatopsis sp. DSM 110486]
METDTSGAGAAFEAHRPVLLGAAYRILGSLDDAEDVVQEAWLRWSEVDHTRVEAPRRFLVKVVSRLAIDRLRLAHRRRETYVGPWLPEPVNTHEGEPLGPADTAAQRDTLSLATLRLMHRLSAPERAVFVLREAFELPYEEIGQVLGLGEAHARQLHRRGASHLATGRDRFTLDPDVHRKLVDRFLTAARTGDRAALQGLLARDVTLWGDGGGKVRARPCGRCPGPRRLAGSSSARSASTPRSSSAPPTSTAKPRWSSGSARRGTSAPSRPPTASSREYSGCPTRTNSAASRRPGDRRPDFE